MANVEVGSGYVSIYPKIDASKASKAVSSLSGTLTGGISKLGLGTAIGSMLARGVSSAAGAISSAVGGAVSRVDTLNNFPKVMESLGYSADTASASINAISEHLDGLPSSTDALASFVQQISATTGNLEQSTKVGLAFNDMMLAGGKGSAVAEGAMVQFNQILAKGKPELEDWRTLMEAAPGQMEQLAQSMLGPQASAMDLYYALGGGGQDATKSMDDLMAAMVALDEEGGESFASFADQAKAATGGIGTAMANVKNRINNAMTDVVQGIGADNIAAAIDGVSSHFSDLGGIVVEFANGVKAGLANSGIQDGLAALEDAWNAALPQIKEDAKQIGEAIGQLATWMAQNMPTIVYWAKIALGAFVGYKAIAPIAAGVRAFKTALSGIDKVGSAAAPALGNLAGNMTKSGNAAKGSAANLLSVGAAALMIGGGIALAAAGFSLMAGAAVSLSNAGWGAVAVFAGMVLGIAALMVVAALVGPALDAGAVGFIAFGAAVALVGVGILAICTGIRLVMDGVTNLINTLPVIEEHATGAGESMRNAMYSVADGIKQVISQLGEAIESFLGSVGQGIADFANNSANGFFQLAAALGALIIPAGLGALALGAFALALGGFALALAAADLAIAAFAGAIELVAGGVSALANAFNALGSAVSALGDGIWNVGEGFKNVGSGISQIAGDGWSAAGALGTITAEAWAIIPALKAAGNDVEGFAKSMGTLAHESGAAAEQVGDGVGAFTACAAATMQTGSAASMAAVQFAAFAATVTGAALQAQSNVSAAMDGMRSSMQSGFDSAGNAATSAFERMGTSAQNAASTAISALNSLRDTVSGMNLTIPTIRVEALPHFEMSGTFNAQTGEVPSVGVSYYASGGVFKRAAVFGEAGREAVVPLNRKSLAPFAEGIAAEMGGGGGTTLVVDGAVVNSRPEIESSLYSILTELRRLGYMQGRA
jgi:tape measure domain-containing protein